MNGGFVLTVLGEDFFHRDALDVAPQLLGKMLVTNIGGEEKRVRITETEVYRGVEDTACHAHKGRTRRTELLFGESGIIYVYLWYALADEYYNGRKRSAAGGAYPCGAGL